MGVFNDQETKIQIALKKLMGKALGATEKTVDGEDYTTAVTSGASTSFAEAPPTTPLETVMTGENAGTPGTITDGVVEYIQLDLEVIPGTTDHGWIAKLPAAYALNVDTDNPLAGTGLWNPGQALATSAGTIQCVPEVYGIPGSNYVAKPYADDGSEILAVDARSWYFDYFSGVFFQEVSSGDFAAGQTKAPATIRVKVWVGDMVAKRIENGWDANTGATDGYVLKGNEADHGGGAGVGVDNMVWTIDGSNNNDPHWAWPMNTASATGMVSPSGETGLVWKLGPNTNDGPAWRPDAVAVINTHDKEGLVKGGSAAGASGHVWMAFDSGDDPDWAALPLSSDGVTGMVDSPAGATDGWVWAATGGVGQWTLNDADGADTDWWELGLDSASFNTHLVTTSSVAIGVGSTGISAYDKGEDTFFFVGGTPGSRAEWLNNNPGTAPGVAHFGGDLVASGNLVVGGTDTYFTASLDADEPAYAHILTGSFIDIGNSGGKVAIRQIGELGKHVLFDTSSLDLITPNKSETEGQSLGHFLEGSHVHVHEYDVTTTSGVGGFVDITGGEHIEVGAGIPAALPLPEYRGGHINISGGPGTQRGGDIIVFAGGGTSTTWAAAAGLTGGQWGGNIMLRAGRGAYAGNVAIAGGKGRYRDNNAQTNGDLPGDDQIRTGDVYIDGGNEHGSNEASHYGNVLINVTTDPHVGPFLNWANAVDGETAPESWTNVIHPTTIFNTHTDVPGSSNEMTTNAVDVKIVADGPGPWPMDYMRCSHYNEEPQEDPLSGPFWAPGVPNGPYKITIECVSNQDIPTIIQATFPSWQTPFIFEWGPDSSILGSGGTPTQFQNDSYHLRITVFPDDTFTGNAAPTLGDIATAMANWLPPAQFPPGTGPWIGFDNSNTFTPSAPNYWCPIRFKPQGGLTEQVLSNFGNNNPIVVGNWSGTFPYGMSSLECPAESNLSLSDETRRGCGIGTPMPRATLHVKDNLRCREVQESNWVFDPGELFDSPIAVEGLRTLPFGHVVLAFPDLTDPNLGTPRARDLLYKYPIDLGGIIGAGNNAKTASPHYKTFTLINDLMAGNGKLINGRYVVDTAEGPHGVTLLDPNEIPYGMSAADLWKDQVILIDTSAADVINQATVLGNSMGGPPRLEIVVPSGFIDANNTAAAGRKFVLKDVGGDASNIHIEILTPVIPPGYPNAGSFEKIDDLGGNSGQVCTMGTDYSCLTLVANGVDGYSIVG